MDRVRKMELNTITNEQAKELLDAATHISNHNIAYLKSMALKCAVQLGISDAIHKNGKPMTIEELTNSLSILPSKAPSLHQVMSLLVHSKFFTKSSVNNGEELFDLTPNSQLLLKDHPLTQTPLTLMGTDPLIVEASHHFARWFRSHNESCESPFHIAHGRPIYESAPTDPTFNELFYQAMTSDSRLTSTVLLIHDEFRGLIQGIESLVDVGGGDGFMTKAIAEAYPEVKCTVFDLPHVVDGLQGNGRGNLTYVAGDMFEAIPCAHVLLLKWIFHNWSDDNCIKILKRCKEAIPGKDKGGKLLIIDTVAGISSDNINKFHKNQLLADVHMLNLLGGRERTEEQWKHLFINAGFSDDFKVFSILGSRSVIEVYPI